MFRRTLLSAIVIGFVVAIGVGRASAQDLEKWGIPCPTGGCRQALKQVRGKHPKAPKAQPPREAAEEASEEASDDRSGCGSQPCKGAQDPDKIPVSKDPIDPDDAAAMGDDVPQGGSIPGHRNIPK